LPKWSGVLDRRSLSEFWRWVWLLWSVIQHRVNAVAEDKFCAESWELQVDCSTLRAWFKGCHFNHYEVRESWHTIALWSLVISCSLSWCLGLRFRSSGNEMLYSFDVCLLMFWKIVVHLKVSNQRRAFVRLLGTEGEIFLGVLDAGNEGTMILWNIRK
jgi:hypothetical protein